MESLSTPSCEPNEPPQPGAVESMLDRPVAQTVAFVADSFGFWGAASLRPWRVGCKAVGTPRKAPPPFAWLVATLFVAGVSLRVFFALNAAPAADSTLLFDDLRTALAEVSLTGSVLVTLPCVLIVALATRCLSWVLGPVEPWSEDRLVSAACHAVGWQFGVVALAFASLVALQVLGCEPTGRLNHLLNQLLPWVVGGTLLWGALLLGPSIADKLSVEGWSATVGGVFAALVFLAPLTTGALWTLGQSVDLRQAARVADQRQQRAWFGDLGVYVLSNRRVDGFDERSTLTVALTNRTEQLILLPREEKLVPLKQVSTGPHQADRDAPALRVVGTSLDYLPDRALLVLPGATRVVEFTVETNPELRGPSGSDRSVRSYGVSYFRRDDDGFVRSLASLPLRMTRTADGRAAGDGESVLR